MNALSQSAPSVWSEVSSPTRGERGGRPGVVFREKQVSFEKTSYSRPACRRRHPSAPRKDATLLHASMAAASAVAAVAVPRAMRAGAFPRRFSSSTTTLSLPARVPPRSPPPIAFAPTRVASRRARAAASLPAGPRSTLRRRSLRRRACRSRVRAIDTRGARPTGPSDGNRRAPHRRSLTFKDAIIIIQSSVVHRRFARLLLPPGSPRRRGVRVPLQVRLPQRR